MFKGTKGFCAKEMIKGSLVVFSLFTASLLFASSAEKLVLNNLPGTNIGRAEEVIASVECVIKDPGTLKEFLGLEKGSLLKIETLNTYVSSLIVSEENLITGFPAVLNFNPRKKQFSFAGSTDSEEGSVVTLQIQGSMNQRNDAFFLFYLQDKDLEASGKAILQSCRRIL